VKATILSVVWKGHGTYEIVFSVDGKTTIATGKVDKQAGINFVSMNPDSLHSIHVSPRLIASVLTALESVNSEGE